MQFQIPQFIETEDKIAGPLTLRQLLYLCAAGGLSFFSFYIFKTWLAIIIAGIFSAIGLSFAFVKYNGQPLIKIALIAFQYFWNPQLYLWKRQAKEVIVQIPEEKVLSQRNNLKQYTFNMPSLSKLWTDMTTTKNPIPQREKAVPVRAVDKEYAVFRKLSGEKETARRIDYR